MSRSDDERKSYFSSQLLLALAPDEPPSGYEERFDEAEATVRLCGDDLVAIATDGKRLPFASVTGLRFWPNQRVGSVVTTSDTQGGPALCEP